jgi:hypothetical protein
MLSSKRAIATGTQAFVGSRLNLQRPVSPCGVGWDVGGQRVLGVFGGRSREMGGESAENNFRSRKLPGPGKRRPRDAQRFSLRTAVFSRQSMAGRVLRRGRELEPLRRRSMVTWLSLILPTLALLTVTLLTVVRPIDAAGLEQGRCRVGWI